MSFSNRSFLADPPSASQNKEFVLSLLIFRVSSSRRRARESGHKEYIVDQAKQRRDKKKIDAVKTKLENIDMQQLAIILIEARKTRVLD